MMCSPLRSDKGFPDAARQPLRAPDGWVDRLDMVRANLESIKLEELRGTPVDHANIVEMEKAIARLEGNVGGPISLAADGSRS
jgi:hypothetical protein